MSAFELCLRFARVDAAVRRRLEVQGLSLNDLAVLHHLDTAPDRRLRRLELADRLGLTPSGIARLLAPLEKLGYVTREADARDARLALVALTGAGAARTHEAVEVAEEKAGALFDRALDDSERATLDRLLGRLAPLA
ncbi:MAG TPA: MarR family transcriptional regulator [Egicoccus sp.]|nr:MarR family transcriptional regulator [Egicoccus sp.]HSK23213.1 MarR family transcriptional regulator [Egicoccus sp.]